MPDNFFDYITLGMGNARSKPKDHSARARTDSSTFYTDRRADFSAEIHQQFAEDEQLRILRHTIQYNPELFVLNNLMMSVEFFANYDEEIADIRKKLVSSREAELNASLPPQKHTLIPDVLQQHVAQRVHFTYVDPDCRLTEELLHPIRIYVSYENVEVTEQSYASYYCHVNQATVYHMQLKPSPAHKGYVLLRRLEVYPPKKQALAFDGHHDSSGSVVNATTSDEIYSETESMYGNKSGSSGAGPSVEGSIYDVQRRFIDTRGNEFAYPSASNDTSLYGSKHLTGNAHQANPRDRHGNAGQSRKMGFLSSTDASIAGSSSTSSGYRSAGNYIDSSDSDSSYPRTCIGAYYRNTPKTSKSSLESGSILSNTEIPHRCFRKIEYTREGKIFDSRKEKKQHRLNGTTTATTTEQLIRQAYYKSGNYSILYLNSAKFMKHFCHLFAEQLAEPMGFKLNVGGETDCHGEAICRTRVEIVDGTTKLEQFEIVPSISCQWPKYAQEWLDRTRGNWPHDHVIERVKELGCHMIPKGGVSSTTEKPSSGRTASTQLDAYLDLEWQLVFPAAERYLETCLTYPQVRVYLMALMLQKTFVRPAGSIFGLTVSHIKNSLFWLVEGDVGASMWTENRTGEALLKLLNSLYRSISQDTPNLPDYFVREKNLFREKSCLLLTQKQLKRIIENPVMYVFHAMENIRHSRKFFPRLDFEELFGILTADKVTLGNPELLLESPALLPRSGPRPYAGPTDHEGQYDRDRSFWDENNQRNSEERRIYGRKQVTKRNLVNPRRAYDQIVEIPVRCEKFEPERISYLLDFFVKHFVKMAERCHAYRALSQKMAYVDQAERLSILLVEYPSHRDLAKNYLEKLSALRRLALGRARASQNTDPGAAAAAAGPAGPAVPSDPPETPRRNLDRAIFTSPLKHRYESPENLRNERQTLKLVDAVEGKIVGSVQSELAPDLPNNQHPLRNTTNDDDSAGSNGKTHVVSIADTPLESFLTETTYV